MTPIYDGPALTVDAVWIRRGKVLLVRRARPPFRYRWALPGGFVELTETVEAAVTRELFEETGLRGAPRALVGVYSGPDRDPRKPTATVAFLMRGPGGVPRGRDDALAASWVPLNEARRLAFDHDRILRDARRRFLELLGDRRTVATTHRERREGLRRVASRGRGGRSVRGTRRALRRLRG